MVQRIHLNTLSDMMIVMLVDHYVKNFHKWQAMLENLMKIELYLLELIINNF